MNLAELENMTFLAQEALKDTTKENPLSTAHYELRLTDLEHLRNLFQKLFMEGEK